MLSLLIIYMVIITSQAIIPILILISIVGLSFAYVGSISSSSSPSFPPNQSQPWLGISAVELRPQISKEIGLEGTSGLLVLQVAPDGPADKAGIKGGNNLKVIEGMEIPLGGDVITRIDGHDIRSLDDFRTQLMDKQVGDMVEFSLTRANGDTQSVDARVEARPA
jgi:S1-C subfamily serine protease